MRCPTGPHGAPATVAGGGSACCAPCTQEHWLRARQACPAAATRGAGKAGNGVVEIREASEFSAV